MRLAAMIGISVTLLAGSAFAQTGPTDVKSELDVLKAIRERHAATDVIVHTVA